MKSKFFRYFFRSFGDTTVGIINADDKEEAMVILEKKYPGITSDCQYYSLDETKFVDGCCEVYYGG